MHYHAHLDVIDASTQATGEKVTVPAGIGFVVQNGKATGITVPAHARHERCASTSSRRSRSPSRWARCSPSGASRVSATQIGGLHADATDEVQVYVNGRKFTGDPATIRLKKHQELALWYGPTGTTPKVPKSYKFPAGL